MGLYRTKPEEVEAIQYTGSITNPFEGKTPAWVWAHISLGTMKFTADGVQITYGDMSETAHPLDWLIMHNDGIVRLCDDATFKKYYTPARKRLAGEEVQGGEEIKTAAE